MIDVVVLFFLFGLAAGLARSELKLPARLYDTLTVPDADVDYAVAACTGTFYAMALAGQRIPRTWARRTAALVWRAAGGRPPTGT